ncbi:hypothetical protein MGN70_013812 [Eutypa lata]|nr:hypothetical protein MGN70_013812 [Eutypa lata]
MATTKQASATVLSDSGDNSDNGLSTELTERPNRNFTKKSFFSWFDANDGPLERRVILKLDFFILTYAFIGFWLLELGLFGNELVQLGSIFSVGYCV